LLLGTDRISNAIQGNEPDLIENIEVVQVAFVEDELQEDGIRVHIYGLQLASLEATPFIWIEAEVAESLELDFVERDLAGHGVLAAGQEREQLDL